MMARNDRRGRGAPASTNGKTNSLASVKPTHGSSGSSSLSAGEPSPRDQLAYLLQLVPSSGPALTGPLQPSAPEALAIDAPKILRQDGCLVFRGRVPLKLLGTWARTMPQGVVMDADAALVLGAKAVLGHPRDIARLRRGHDEAVDFEPIAGSN